MSAKLVLSGVRKRFGDNEVCKGIDLTVQEGQMVCLIGASGSGKSTLLRCINLLEPVDDGTILLDGRDIAEPGLDPQPVRARIGMVFQSYNLFPHMTAAENVMLAPRRVHGRSRSDLQVPVTALFERFNIEVIATTESPLDDLKWHAMIRDSGWTGGKVVTAYRPDPVVDPDFEGFAENVEKFGELTGVDATKYDNYLEAHRIRRAFFKQYGATSTDHGHPTARTEDLSRSDAKALLKKALKGECSAEEADAFRGHMLTEMARMSLEDGLVLQIHPGSTRNHSAEVMARHGRDKGFDIPAQTNYVEALRPLLNAVGMEPDLTIVLFTLDETAYSRELAPLAGVYPALRLGPAWWFHDSPEGMRRYREMVTETAGFYNTVGFNDDTRAFCSIPARHDVARRVDCAFLATLVATGRLDEDEAPEVARDLTYNLVKRAYRL